MFNKYYIFVATFICFQITSLYANAEDAPDNWPCVQRYIPELSAAVIWPNDLDEISTEELSNDVDFQANVKQLADRRKSLDTANDKVAEYITQHNGDQTLLINQLFVDVFAKIQRERKRIIQGIFRYTDRQRSLGSRIDEQRRKLKSVDGENIDDESVAEKLEDLEARQKWDIRAFRERERQLNYLCEQPVLLEQRLFSVAKNLQVLIAE